MMEQSSLVLWLLGSCFSVISVLVIVVTYARFRTFRRHPNNLVVLRSVLDAVFCILLFQLPAMQTTNNEFLDARCETSASKVLAFMTQVTALGSELCFLVICVDLTMSVRNPFTNFKANTTRYRWFIFVVSVGTGIALVTIPQASGLSSLGICWTQGQFDMGTNLSAFNQYSWSFFYIPVIFIYVTSGTSLIFTFQRLRGGLPASFEAHNGVIHANLRYVVGYGVYWSIAAALYAASFWLGLNFATINPGAPPGLMQVLALVLGGKSVVTLIVWLWNAKEIDWKDLNSDGEGKMTRDLNAVLRGEVLLYTTQGIRTSIEMANASEVGTKKVQFRRLRHGGYLDIRDGSRIVFNADNDVVVHAPSAPSGGTVRADGGELGTPLMGSGLPLSSDIIHDTSFFDFSPREFQEIRQLSGISNHSYSDSLRHTTKERFSEGASGAFLYYSQDHRFIVKTTTKQECEFLLSILPYYKAYLRANPNTLITKFFGCHMCQLYTSEMYFLIMQDVFSTDLPIHERYDLKGSWVNRNASAVAAGQRKDCRHCHQSFIVGSPQNCRMSPNRSCEPNRVLKDNDRNDKCHASPEDARSIIQQLTADSNFLRDHHVMDYSLLLGVHRRSVDVSLSVPDSGGPDGPRRTCIAATRVEGPALYFMGVIDILQEWDWNKRLERWFKIYFRFKPKKGLSAIEPREYSQRFQERVVNELFHGEDFAPGPTPIPPAAVVAGAHV